MTYTQALIKAAAYRRPGSLLFGVSPYQGARPVIPQPGYMKYVDAYTAADRGSSAAKSIAAAGKAANPLYKTVRNSLPKAKLSKGFFGLSVLSGINAGTKGAKTYDSRSDTFGRITDTVTDPLNYLSVWNKNPYAIIALNTIGSADLVQREANDNWAPLLRRKYPGQRRVGTAIDSVASFITAPHVSSKYHNHLRDLHRSVKDLKHTIVESKRFASGLSNNNPYKIAILRAAR